MENIESKKKKMEERQKRIGERMKKIKYKISIMSGKGGVGKSTVAANLAFSLSIDGIATGLLDSDIHGPDIPKILGIENSRLTGDENRMHPVVASPNLKVVSMAFLLEDRNTPVIWRGPLKMMAIQQFLGDIWWGDIDYLIVDLPPGTGDEALSIAQLIPNSFAIIVTTPQDLALLDSRKAINFARKLKMNVLGIIENMSGMKCPHCGGKIDLFKIGGGKNAAEEMGVPFLGAIPIDPEIVKDGDEGKPFILNHADSDAAKAFDGIVKNIKKAIEG